MPELDLDDGPEREGPYRDPRDAAAASDARHEDIRDEQDQGQAGQPAAGGPSGGAGADDGRRVIAGMRTRYRPSGDTVNIRAIPAGLVDALRRDLRGIQDPLVDGDLADETHGLSSPGIVCAWLIATTGAGREAFADDPRVLRAADLYRDRMDTLKTAGRLSALERSAKRLDRAVARMSAAVDDIGTDTAAGLSLTAFLAAFQAYTAQASADGMLGKVDTGWLQARLVARSAVDRARRERGGAPVRPSMVRGTTAAQEADDPSRRVLSPSQGQAPQTPARRRPGDDLIANAAA